jgi:hypothetical protein
MRAGKIYKSKARTAKPTRPILWCNKKHPKLPAWLILIFASIKTPGTNHALNL